ncbi:MAG: hemerythrin domain-containing protein [Nitrospira sp.]|nr:hemerythrin domain-containing protein [Nitrospira sp.]
MPERTISTMFDEDHERLDALFKSFQTLKRTDFPKAKSAFLEFKAGLQRHVVWEEDILFPLWERKSGMTGGGPTIVMRSEHREIGDRLESLSRKIQAQNLETEREEEFLLDLLDRHNMSEEEVLYPEMDHIISPEEREAAFRAMEKIA